MACCCFCHQTGNGTSSNPVERTPHHSLLSQTETCTALHSIHWRGIHKGPHPVFFSVGVVPYSIPCSILEKVSVSVASSFLISSTLKSSLHVKGQQGHFSGSCRSGGPFQGTGAHSVVTLFHSASECEFCNYPSLNYLSCRV